ncbi:hypothetical protein E2C01_080073 [Portunus trituberculatus]|uniref:Ig-like domain-containing protein n=1 Tax=Portunus trituberculatus TaxID=210409 RepID=A0A5B7IYJ5_PORTR|nr:hypothetical protein [Portunus trituberculatus]
MPPLHVQIASPNAPTVHPINLIVEGGKMTVLCIAMGSPPPTVSLYISGVLIHQVRRKLRRAPHSDGASYTKE